MSTVYLLRALNEKAQEWLDEHVQYEDWQLLGRGIGIEHRYVAEIIEGLNDAGFELGVDYELIS